MEIPMVIIPNHSSLPESLRENIMTLFATRKLVIPVWVHERAFSHTCIPFVSAIFPETSLTPANRIEVLDRLDSHDKLCVFVS